MKRLTKEEIEYKIKNRWGEVQYELIQYGSAREPITIYCLNCNDTFTLKYSANLFNKNRKNFCPNCHGTKKIWYNVTKESIDLNIAQKRLDETFDGEYIIMPNSYTGWVKKCLVRHTLCGKIFSTQPRYLFYHSHCPCQNISSKGEKRIEDFLILNSIPYESQKRLENIKRAPYDFFLPTYNLLIEFQGRQHFEPVKQFGGAPQLEIQKEIDKRKYEEAMKQHYSIFYITYQQMNEIEELLVQRLSLTGVEPSGSKSQSSQKEN